MVAEQLNSD